MDNRKQTCPTPSQTDAYHRIAAELTPEALSAFLEAHPVLQHYEFLRGAPLGNGVVSVRRLDGEVVVGSMWAGMA